MTSEQREEREPEDETHALYTSADVAASDLDNAAWQAARVVPITRYWSGELAPLERHAEARLLWSFVVSLRPQTARKTIGLWDRDVCELFIAPDAREPERYFEFEAAPTGEWLDLAIRQTTDERETDWDFHSGMTVAARITENNIMVAMRVPWKAFGRKPRPTERWLGNLLRCVGAGATRGYLAWRPTYTEEPNFHVPAAFGWIEFKG
jgi:hypothetical protein